MALTIITAELFLTFIYIFRLATPDILWRKFEELVPTAV